MKIGITCQSCGADNCKVLESRPITRDVRRRRWSCNKCGFRWTIYTNRKGQEISQPPKTKVSPHPRSGRKLKNDEVKFILTEIDLNNKELGDRFNLSRETIRLIRIGSIYRDVHPELERTKPNYSTRPSCKKCVNWKGYCSMDVPDPEVEGVKFAKDCVFYEVLYSDPSAPINNL